MKKQRNKIYLAQNWVIILLFIWNIVLTGIVATKGNFIKTYTQPPQIILEPITIKE